jgi:hypothetical protein
VLSSNFEIPTIPYLLTFYCKQYSTSTLLVQKISLFMGNSITRQTLYRHVEPKGQLRDDAHKLIAQKI